MAKPCTPHLIAQRVQLFKPQTGNVGVKGQCPLRSLGGKRGPFSHVREWPPLFTAALGLQYSSLKRGIFQKSNEILLSRSIKQMHQFGIKPKLHRRMPRIRHRINIRGGNDCHNILPIRGKVQMQLAAHQLADVDLGRDAALAERDMHGAHARGDTAALDACGGELTIRKDDAPETVKARLDTYHRETEPLKAFYAERGKLKTVENQPTISETTAEIKKALGI